MVAMINIARRIAAIGRGLCRPAVGMQVKSVLVLTVVVLVITAAAGWSYYAVVEGWLNDLRRCHVNVLAESLARSVEDPLCAGEVEPLDGIAQDFVLTDGIRGIAILDAEGVALATASAPADGHWSVPADWPVSVSRTEQYAAGVFAVARPVVEVPDGGQTPQLVGSVRMVIDTTPLAISLAEVRKTMLLIAAVLIGFGLPLGYLLVWRVLVQPVRRLVSVTSRLAGGDYSARVRMSRADEIGELACSFDKMADEIARSREALLAANERLERKVRLRTAELRRTNRRLRNEVAEKEDFLRAVSHDLNAPLRNISGLTETVLRRLRGGPAEQEAGRLERVRANVTLACGMVEDLLELSRIKTRPQRREPTDMHELVRDVVSAFEFDISSRGIALEIDPHMPTLCIERRRLRQAFQNLIDNALKYMHRDGDGWIRVGYRRREGRHEFYVADNGPGLSADQHREVFCIFRRAANPATAGVEGKGVGLALVKAIAANHDGDAWVESVEGEGSTFYLALRAEEVTTEEPPDDIGSRTEQPAEAVTTGAPFSGEESS
ncbi:MAG: sensor histidine kinase [Phycisphaerae bacterium]